MNVAIRRALDQPQRIYAADGSALPQRGQTRAWDEADHPRGPDGKFTAGGLRVPSGPMLMPHPEGDEFYATRLPNSSLSDADRAVALEYAWGGPAFERMNRALRGDPDTEVTPEVAEGIAKLTGVISHHYVPPTKVYRGVPDDEKTRAWLASRDSKGHIVDHGFMSTSTDEQIALDAADPTGDGGGVVFEIKLPQGTQAMALGDLFDEEGGFDQREVLVQRGSKFKVGRRRKVDGRTHIQLTMVSQIPRTGAAGRSGWNEADHPRGPGGRFSSAGSVVVIDPSVYREAFFNEPDPVARAADLYSDTMQGMNLIRTVIRNKQAGRSPFDDGDGRDVRDGEDYYLLQQYLLPLGQIKDPLSGDTVYGPEDLDREIIGAADLIERQIRQAPPATVPLSRGTRIPQSDLPNPGDEFDAGNAGVTSWTTDQDRADRYSMPGDLVEDGRRVRIVLDGPVPAHDLGSQKRTSRTGDDGEHLVGGGQRVRVASVEKQGDGPRAIFEIRVVPV